LDRLVPALTGQPVGWDNDAFIALQAVYAEPSPATGTSRS
jgi:hypothetical protein